MPSRKGTLLEKNVEQLLKISGFNPELNKIHNGYEIDVFLRWNNIKIAFECKQYERSTLAIRNLIHQWDSKNKELGFDKIVLVLVGCDISPKDHQLANKYGIVIWDEEKLSQLLDEAISKKIKNRSRILNELQIKEAEIKEEFEREIELKQTEQQIIIKEALDEMLRRGLRGGGFINFSEKGADYNIEYFFTGKGFMLKFMGSLHLVDISQLLLSLEFKEIDYVDIGFFKKRKMPSTKVDDLNESQFGVYGNYYLDLYAQCGEKTFFIAYLTDRIFREIFKAGDNYKIKVKRELEDGY